MCYFRTAVLPYPQENRVIQIHQQQVKFCPTSAYSSISLSKTQTLLAIIMEKVISHFKRNHQVWNTYPVSLILLLKHTTKKHHLKTAKSVLQFKPHSNNTLLLLQTSKADFSIVFGCLLFLPKKLRQLD